MERLILDGHHVVGVALADDQEVRGSAVLLACGGFEGDPGLTDAYLPLGPAFPSATPGTTAPACT